MYGLSGGCFSFRLGCGAACLGFVLAAAATILTGSGSDSSSLLLDSASESDLAAAAVDLCTAVARLLSVHLVLASTCQLHSFEYPPPSKDCQPAWAPLQSSH